MRHQVFGKKLNRDIKERKALFRSLIHALIKHGKIKTTVAKAKAVRSIAEKLVTHAKENTTSAVYKVASFLNRKESIDKLVKDIAPRFKNKLGGYLRIIRVGKRPGDNAEEAILEWSVKKVEEKKIEQKLDKKLKETKIQKNKK